MIRRTAVVLIALLVSSSAQSTFITFQIWSAHSEMYRMAYIAGAFDTLTLGEEGDHWARCILSAKMNNGQLATNVMNFAKDKPALQVGAVQGVLLQYLNAACGKPPTK